MASRWSTKWVAISAFGGAACVGLAWLTSTRTEQADARAARSAEPDALRRAHPPRKSSQHPTATAPRRGARERLEEERDRGGELEETEQAAAPQLTTSGVAPRLRGSLLDGVDPCLPLSEPAIPAELERVKAQNVTVVWPPELSVAEPLALAYTVAGLLEEAALVTGTPRRGRLVVMLHGTREELHLSTNTPEWSSGVYDGLVHVVHDPHADFGVRLATLRHEVMHAQLHVAAGCMPAWFNEGTAQYFSGKPAAGGWIKLLRERTSFDLDALSVPTIVESPKEDAERLYAQSLAMVLYAVDQAGEDSLQDVVQELQDGGTADRREHARRLWRRLFPGVEGPEIWRSLAQRVVGRGSEAELEQVLGAPLCCTGERRISEFRCQPAPPLSPFEQAPADRHSSRCVRY